MQDHVTNENHISTTKIHVATKVGRAGIYNERPSINSRVVIIAGYAGFAGKRVIF